MEVLDYILRVAVGTIIYYFIKMTKLKDTEKKLNLTYNSMGLVMLEQTLALVIEWVYLAATLNGLLYLPLVVWEYYVEYYVE